MDTITVDIPVSYLLQLAVAGKMGDGELLLAIKQWAENKCIEHGLKENMLTLLDKRLKDMRTRLTNIVGNDLMNEIDVAIETTFEKIKNKVP